MPDKTDTTLTQEYASKILKHVKSSYYQENVWFTDVASILNEFAAIIRIQTLQELELQERGKL